MIQGMGAKTGGEGRRSGARAWERDRAVTLAGILPSNGQYKSTFKVGRTLTSVLHQSLLLLKLGARRVPTFNSSRLPVLRWPRGPAPLRVRRDLEKEKGAAPRGRWGRRDRGGRPLEREVPELGTREGADPRTQPPGSHRPAPPRPAGPPARQPRRTRVRVGAARPSWLVERRSRPVASCPRRRARPAPSRHHAEGECAPPRKREGPGSVRARPSRPAPGDWGAGGKGRGLGRWVSRGRGRSLGVRRGAAPFGRLGGTLGTVGSLLA